MSRYGQTVLALVAAGVVLAFVAWFDHSVMTEAVQKAESTFDLSGEERAWTLGTLLVAGGALLVGWVGWRAGSIVASVVYIVVGGLFATLPLVVWNLAATINNAPPVLPDPLASRINDLYFSTSGPLNGVGTVGAAIFITGIATVMKIARDRTVVVRQETVAPSFEPPAVR